MNLKSRKERRQEARENKVKFVPQYSGIAPRSFEDVYGKGYERFNNKYVTIKEIQE